MSVHITTEGDDQGKGNVEGILGAHAKDNGLWTTTDNDYVCSLLGSNELVCFHKSRFSDDMLNKKIQGNQTQFSYGIQ